MTVMKRYSDFRKLESDLFKTYKSYNLKTFFKSDNTYFNRFDPEVIEQRKKNILEFLYYCAETPVIYRSQYFVKFFEDTSTESESPVREITESFEESLDDSSLSIDMQHDDAIEKSNISEEKVVDELNLNSDMDYLYDAALSFSQAVQEEANVRYKEAFSLYKNGIDKLLTGAKSDNNELRKKIAKTKASKYLEKAEQLYENYILQQEENECFVEDTDGDEAESITSLERPFNQMSRFKVIKVNGRLMQVQDCTDKKMYMIKVIWKSPLNRVLFMPQNIPYMVPILNFFNTENAVFLLIPFVSGGLLWDYVTSYVTSYKSSNGDHKIEELFVEPPEFRSCDEVDALIDVNVTAQEDITIPATIESSLDTESFEQELEVPAFDVLNDDIDIDDLMKCSQNLLKSVTKTLEKSVILSSNIDESECAQIESEAEKCADAESIKEEEEDAIEIESKDQEIIDVNESIPLPEMIIKQWAAEMIICVNNLHKNGIILGDLNLDNILLGPRGHIMLTYFHQNNRNNYQQLSHLNPKAIKCMYVAFEFPLTKSSDYFSVGVILYEIFTKCRFYALHPGGISKYNEIQYPSNNNLTLSEEAKDLLEKLIFEQPDKRPSYDNIVSHPFFHDVNFDEIAECGLNLI